MTIRTIIGIDEVGRGALAGPIVCASFSLDLKALKEISMLASKGINSPKSQKLLKRLLKIINYDVGDVKSLNGTRINKNTNNKIIYDLEILKLVFDSKKVTKNNRIKIVNYLLKNKIGKNGFGICSNIVIDSKGIQYANKLSMLKTLNIHLADAKGPFLVLTDHLDPRGVGNYKLDREFEIKTEDKMDTKSFVVACASILAKEYRDELMGKYSKLYPEYGFEKHVGYGTKFHLEKIKEFGLCKIHRKSFTKNLPRR